MLGDGRCQDKYSGLYPVAGEVSSLMQGDYIGTAFGLIPFGKKAKKAAEILRANKIAGKKAENKVTEALQKEFPNDDVLEQVTGKFDDGTTTRFDNVVVDPKTGKPKLLNETKYGNATHSKQQSRFHKDGESVTLRGKKAGGAAGSKVNTSTTTTRTTRVNQEDLD